MTPGCRRVRSFFSAFLARGREDLLAAMSKENILQLLPSSCDSQVSQVYLYHPSPGAALEMQQIEE
jgi:hypothetical protein